MVNIFAPTPTLFILPQIILLLLVTGWLILSSGFKDPDGNIRRGYKIQEKPLKTIYLQYLIGLEDGIIQPPPKVDFFTLLMPGFILKRDNQILIYGGDLRLISTKDGRLATPVGYINLEKSEPVLEIRLWIPAKWLIILLVAKLFLIDQMSLFPSMIITLYFSMLCIFNFSIETSAIENFLNKQAQAGTKTKPKSSNTFAN